jgi:hypothetical protein
MPVNTTLADASNGLLLSTLILYALAMLCYAGDLAFARHRVLAGIDSATDADAKVTGARVPELVGAGAPAAGAGGPASGSRTVRRTAKVAGGRAGGPPERGCAPASASPASASFCMSLPS